ncbi:MAG: NAD(P)H-binding protein [Planctomycetota bacterium]
MSNTHREAGKRLHVVTGALGYTGKAVTEQLLARGDRVRTLTNSPNRPNPFGDRLEVRPLAFDDPGALAESLRGCDTLFNTYWVRFNHRLFTFEQAAANTRSLFEAARVAGVRRVVHVSILKPEQGTGLAYYDGKRALEDNLRASGLSHAIVRPGVLFGRGDILVNNIAWVLRRLPIFGVFGDGRYTLQPMHVDDMASLMIESGDREEDVTVDAVGPETFAYADLVETIAKIIGVRRPIVSVPPTLGYWVGRALGPMVGDVIITREEVTGLMRGLLFSDHDRVGTTRLTDWMRAHADSLGKRYASEVARRVRREESYEQIAGAA